MVRGRVKPETRSGSHPFWELTSAGLGSDLFHAVIWDTRFALDPFLGSEHYDRAARGEESGEDDGGVRRRSKIYKAGPADRQAGYSYHEAALLDQFQTVLLRSFPVRGVVDIQHSPPLIQSMVNHLPKLSPHQYRQIDAICLDQYHKLV